MTIDHFEIFIVKPKASTNLCTNPSFETGTTGWITSGTNTIAQSSEQARRGIYSCKITYQDTKTNYIADTLTLTSIAYTGSLDIYIPANYDGSDLVLSWSLFTNATITVGRPNMTVRDKWQRVHTHITPDAGDLTGYFTLYENGATPTAGRYIYVDGALVEAGSEPTTYFDGDSEGFGDENQLEYWWDNIVHASKSYRSLITQSGGELIPISDYCKRIGIYGLGSSPIQSVDIPMTDGTARYLYSKGSARYFTIKVAFTDLTVGAIDAKRLALLSLISPLNSKADQPLLLKFVGYDSNNNIDSKILDCKCVYVSGLDQSPQTNKPYVTDITFKMHDNYMEAEGDIVQSLTGFTSTTTSYVVGVVKNDGTIVALGTCSSVASPNATIKQNPVTGEIWVGGDFTDYDSDTAKDHLMKFAGFDASPKMVKPTTGASPNSAVYGIAFDYSGRAYVVGNFTALGGTATNYVGRVNTDGSVSAITGAGATLKSICYRSSTGVFYAGGTACYSISGLSLSSETIGGSDIRVIRESPSGDVYAYCHSDLTIYKKTGSDAFASFVTISGTGAQVFDMAWDNKGIMYVAGKFTTIGGVTVDGNLAYYDGVWHEIIGFNNLAGNTGVHSLQWVNDKMLIAGNFIGIDADYEIESFCWYKNHQSTPVPIYFVVPSTSHIHRAFMDDRNQLWFMGGLGIAMYNGELNSIINNGDKVYPELFIKHTANIGLFYIKNNNNNKMMVFEELTVLADQSIKVDFSTDNFDLILSGLGSRINKIKKYSDKDFYLENGTNSIRICTSAQPSICCFIYREKFSSLDGWLK